jgi:hypothetical protein
LIGMARPEHLTCWNISAGTYPRGASLMSRLRFLIGYAILAPSSHNTQPWRFQIDESGVDVYTDRSRLLEVIDGEGRQLFMSVGGALFNLRAAMRRFGHEPNVEFFPSKRETDLVARVTHGRKIATTIEDVELFDAIPARHTNRQPFDPVPVSFRITDALVRAAHREGAWLMRLHPDERTRAAELIAAADRKQFNDKRFRKELAHWLVSNKSARGDGIPGYSKSYGAPSTATTLLVRTFDIGGRVAEGERDLVNGSPMLAVLGTDRDDERAWLNAGQAMQRALLTACVHGLSASFLNQALELDEFRTEFEDLTGHGQPQLVLRFGYGATARPTPRRPVGEVLGAPEIPYAVASEPKQNVG